MPRTAAPVFTLRPEERADEGVLRGLYIIGRWQEMAAAGMPEAERPEFLTWQYYQQHDQFAAAGAEVWVIEVAGDVAGRLVVQDGPGTLSVLDLAVMPPWQGQGLEAGVLALAGQRAAEDGQALAVPGAPA